MDGSRLVRRRRASSRRWGHGVIAVVVALAVAGLFGLWAPLAAGQPDRTFTVNSLGDVGDPNAQQPNDDGVCDTGNVLPDGQPECTLRAAIENQNAVRFLAHNLIRFAIDADRLGADPHIDVGSTGLGELPFVLGSVTIDGTTQQDAGGNTVRIELRGAQAGAGAIGLQVRGAATTVTGLKVTGFGGDGILVSGTGPPGEGGHFIVDNHVSSNGDDGVHVESHDTFVEDNVVSGNSETGVHLVGDGVERNVVLGNGISGNGGNGVLVEAPNNGILRNHVSGNAANGIHLLGAAATGNLVQGNRIGTTADGNAAQANGGDGIRLAGSGPNQLGVGDANVVSGNGGNGIFIGGAAAAGTEVQDNLVGTNAAGDAAIANASDGIHVSGTPGLTIGGGGAGNVVSGNTGNGVVIDGAAAMGDTVAGNTVGLSRDGRTPLPNQLDAVLVQDAPNTTVGGTDAASANRLHGTDNGVRVQGSLAKGVTVQGNFIGKDGTGAKFKVGVLHRGGSQLSVEGNAITNIAGVGVDARLDADGGYNIRRNRIFGRMEVGTKLTFGPGRTVDVFYKNNFQVGNGIGLEGEETIGGTINWDVGGNDVSAGGVGARIKLRAAGTKKFDQDHWDVNAQVGFELDARVSRDVAVGMKIEMTGEHYNGNTGNADGLRITVHAEAEVRFTLLRLEAAGNGGRGISVEAFALAGGKVILNGQQLDVSFNGQVGLRVRNGSGVTPFVSVGLEHSIFTGNTKGAVALFGVEFKFSLVDNTVADNGDFGLLVGDTSDGRIAGNRISGSPVGVVVQDTATATVSDNTVTGNGVGLLVAGAAHAALAANLVFGNSGLGIDLGGDGVTPNDPGDADSGPSGLQNFPLLSSVAPSAGATTIRGSLDSTPDARFRLHFFSSTACDGSGFGEGERPLGTHDVLTDAGGHADFTVDVPTAVAAADVVTATATRLVDDDGDPATPPAPRDSSEFSRCLAAGASDTVQPATRASVVPAANASGWNNTPVTVELNASDAGGSGVKEIVYSATGAQALPTTTVPGSAASLALAAEGVTTVRFFARDNAGNTEATKTHVVRIDRTAPALIVTALVVNATAPSGALVGAYPVSATDRLDPTPTIACFPPVPHRFPINAPDSFSTVQCTATDQAGNSTTRSFTVHVRGAAEQIADVRALILAFHLPERVARKFLDKLAKIADFLERGKRHGACIHLRSFVIHVNIGRGKALTKTQAAQLVAAAHRIGAVLGCTTRGRASAAGTGAGFGTPRDWGVRYGAAPTVS